MEIITKQCGAILGRPGVYIFFVRRQYLKNHGPGVQWAHHLGGAHQNQ